MNCATTLEQGQKPVNALANGLWIGDVPKELQDLSWTEKMMISQIKHNICIVKVHVSGMSKMKANVVSHSLPVSKVNQALPPPREKLEMYWHFCTLGQINQQPRSINVPPC